jgi:hypothetical protein
MNWMNSKRASRICFAGIAFVIMALFFVSSCNGPTPTNTLAPTDIPLPVTTIASVPPDTPTITSPPTATDTPTPTYPAPTLVNPAPPGATIVGEKLTNFSWHWDSILQEGERFDLRIWRSEKPRCTVAMPYESSYLLDAPPNGFGHYLWQVAVARIDEGGSKLTLSESLIWPFVWSDVPPTSIPTTTPTPTSQPDAVVKVENLNLRSGPDTVYDILGVLSWGDPLEVTGRNLAGDWLKVIVPGGQEGWVAASLLEINLPLAGVAIAQPSPVPTPMYTPTPTPTPTPDLLPPPIPLEPENGAAFIGGPVILKWKLADDRPLGPDELFSLRMRKEGETRICHHDQARDMEYWGDPLSYCTAGKLYWGVTLVRELCTDCPEEERWQELSEPSEAREERWIYYTPGEEPWAWPTPDDGDDGDDDGGGGVWRP